METLRKLGDIEFSNEFWIFMLPGILMLTDFITGFIKAWKKHEIKSSKMREGLAKKYGEFVCLIIGELFVVSVKVPSYFIKAISGYIILMELISITENLDIIGVPIPKPIKRALKVINEKIQNDGKEDKNDGSN